MPNPRFMSRNGEPTVEMLQLLTRAKQVFLHNLEWFCEKYGYSQEELKGIDGVYLIGSHANEGGWKNSTSDVDLKLTNPNADPENLLRYKREVLDPLFKQGEKRRWIDVYFVREAYQVTPPGWDLTQYWQKIEVQRQES